jgi:2-polyprenyl-3-methyl-5-hydroxy-6-metoxy-1,4-benzoquinol methylase
VNCRHCHSSLRNRFIDLGFAPPSNAYLTEANLSEPEISYPLRVMVCEECWLVQTEDFAKADELFRPDYAYFSSTSTSWLNHAKSFSEFIIKKLALGGSSFVVEIASNDGYLLKNFLTAEIPSLGIEPTASTAKAAEALGITVLKTFFSQECAEELADSGKKADLVIANNVFAHVPDINDFAKGITTLLKPDGVVTLEFPHFLELIKHTQFDTIYHEHYSYLSLTTVQKVLASAALRIFDVERLVTHGGSLRVYACRNDAKHKNNARLGEIIAEERDHGLLDPVTYTRFQSKANHIKDSLLKYLLESKQKGLKVVAYGAAAKGNTLLNYAGIRQDLLPYVCDASVAKQGKFLPGSHIPILAPEILWKDKPEIVLILPWNLSGEIQTQLQELKQYGTEFKNPHQISKQENQ